MKTILFATLLSLFAGLFNAALACTYKTSTTTKYAYELVNEARTSRLTLCVDNKKFYGYELENIAEAGARIRILADKVSFYTYEVSNIAKKGKTDYVLGSTSKYAYELENMVRDGVHVTVNTSKTTFYAYELVNIAKARPERGYGRLTLIVDNNRLASYELQNIRDAGGSVITLDRDND